VSDSLSLAEHVLSRGRLMIHLGRPVDARRLLGRFIRQPDLSPRLRAEAYRLVAGIELRFGRYRRGRRLLAAAIRLRRHADDLYIEYARAVEADPDGKPALAVKALRRAVAIDPFEPRSWAALGSAAVRAGDRTLARKAFRRAARLRPEEIETLGEIVDGFVALGRADEARAALTAARFRSPSDAAVAALRDRFRFTLAVRGQRQTGADCILPFPVRPVEVTASAGEGVVLRADRKSTPAPHLLRLLGGRADPRRAR
jgi:tetratricopeptide (TPR) repeat protein